MVKINASFQVQQFADRVTIQYTYPVVGDTLTFIPIDPSEFMLVKNMFAQAPDTEVYRIAPPLLRGISEGNPVSVYSGKFRVVLNPPEGMAAYVEAISMFTVNVQEVTAVLDNGYTYTVSTNLYFWVDCAYIHKHFLNLYHSLGIFSRRQNDVIFLIFPRKQDLTFHANCLLRRQFA